MSDTNQDTPQFTIESHRIGDLVVRIWSLEAEIEHLRTINSNLEAQVKSLQESTKVIETTTKSPYSDKTFDRYGNTQD